VRSRRKDLMKKLFIKRVNLTVKKVTGAPFPSQVTRTDNAGQDKRVIHTYPSGTLRPRKKLNPPTTIFPYAAASDTSADQQLLASSRMLPSQINLLQNNSLGLLPTSGPYPLGGEETNVVSNDKVVFATGNYFAALSIDGGAHFDYLDPTTVFPTADGGFCAIRSSSIARRLTDSSGSFSTRKMRIMRIDIE
jgi:hypothetical protein